MRALIAGALMALFTLSACGPSGMQGDYRVSRTETSEIQYRVLDGVNVLRQARGLAPLQLNANLNAAAATHARDMSVQDRPWAWGSDLSTPLQLVARSGYSGMLRSLIVSESFETELETLAAWLEDPVKRDSLLDPRATDMGFGFYQERRGKIWWTLITGRSSTAFSAL